MANHAAIVREAYDAFNRRDAPACLSHFHPAAEWTSAENFLYADESPYVGAEAIQRLLFERILGDWDNFSLTLEEILADGHLVILNGRFKGKFKASGASINAQFVHVLQFREGKIARCQMYTDTAQFKDATGRTRLPEAIALGT